DIDGDGVPDYAATSYFFATNFRVVVFSGATGAVIRTIDAPWDTILGVGDLDQDGVPDLLGSNDGYPINPPSSYGRVQAFSMRDGGPIWNVDHDRALTGQSSIGIGAQMAWIGAVPGTPYPAFAWLDSNRYAPSAYGTVGCIRAWIGNRVGTGPVVGVPCA